ncbi:response regulator transcription factor [Qipengyuania sp. NPDC077563]|uniref:response regulator transcription factor n=1 Tax=Qipengyuania sp. NPDC077563 TaxID=3364497 RepID=UPI00384D7AE6
MRIYIVEADESVRATLKQLLEDTDHEVEWYKSGRNFVRKSRKVPPGCIVADKNLPDLQASHAQCELLQECKDRHEVILLSRPCDVCDAVAAMRAGVLDFFELPYRRAELLDAITRAQLRLEERVAEKREDAKNLQLFGKLTKRELSVLRASKDGESSKIAAYKLGLSPRTVEMYRSRILQKLKVPSFSAALVKAQAARLLHS